MTINNSHNSYWAKDPISHLEQCNCIEADILWFRKKICLSHSWRPFKFLMYGELEERYLKPLQDKVLTEPIYLYIELKSGNFNMLDELYNLLKQYERPGLIYILHAQDNNWYQRVFQKKEKGLSYFIRKYINKVSFVTKTLLTSLYTIKNIDLYESSINHF